MSYPLRPEFAMTKSNYSLGGRKGRTAPLVELMGRVQPDVAFLESELLPGKGGLLFCYDYSREGGTVVWPAQSR